MRNPLSACPPPIAAMALSTISTAALEAALATVETAHSSPAAATLMILFINSSADC